MFPPPPLVINKNIDKQLGKCRFSQKAFVFRDDNAFLTLRRTKEAPTHPLHWDLPGGAIERGEDPTAAALREIKEESGLSVINLTMFDVASNINEFDEYWVTLAYTAHTKEQTVHISWEHDKYEWITLDAFITRDIPDTQRRFAQTLIQTHIHHS